jgi:hypothetical protein
MIDDIELVASVIGLVVVGMIVGVSTANFILWVTGNWWMVRLFWTSMDGRHES